MSTEYWNERTLQRRHKHEFLAGRLTASVRYIEIEMLLTLGGRLSVPIYPSEIGLPAIAYNGQLCDKITSQHARIEILD